MVSYFFWGEGARRTAPGAFILFLLFGWSDFYCTIAEKMLVMAIRMQTGTAGVFDLLADEANECTTPRIVIIGQQRREKAVQPPLRAFLSRRAGRRMSIVHIS